MFLLMLLSVPAALAIFAIGYVAAIVRHAEPLAHGREITHSLSDGEVREDAWTATDGLILAGLRLNR